MNKYERAGKAILQARRQLEKGDSDSVHLANYMLRDLELTQEANLTDLAWAMHLNNPHRNDVQGLIEHLEKYMKSHPATPSSFRGRTGQVP